jgi:hypothetical protein
MLTENYNLRMIQAPDRQVYGINQDFLDIIDKESIDFDRGESSPTGPCFSGYISNGVYWYNDFGIVMIFPIKSKKTEIPKVLSLLEFKEDGSIDERDFRKLFKQVLEEESETAGEDDSEE